MPLRNLILLVSSAVVSVLCYQRASHNRYADVITETMETIEANYVEPVERRELFDNALRGMVSDLDPHSTYISPEEFRQFEESLNQEFGGIGIIVEMNPETERLTVMSPLVGTPAFRAGIRAGDMIEEVDGTSTEGMSLLDSVKYMRGPEGSDVTIKIRRKGRVDLLTYTLQREIIPIESVMGDTRRGDGAWNYFLNEQPGIGYIRLTTFGDLSTQELTDALGSYRRHPVDALILDLRGNAGGLLTTAVDVCDMFIDGGDIVSTRGRGGALRRRYAAGPNTLLPTDIPMVVMIDHYSASASEIVAACLQDHDRAAIVGERSWGKGTVQNIFRLEGGKSALKLTTASYWRPSKKNIHRHKDAKDSDDWGVRPDPDLEVKLTDEEYGRLLEWRRERDIVHSPNEQRSDDAPEPAEPPAPGVADDAAGDADPPEDAASSGESDPPDAGEDVAEPAVDPQLKKAVDYLLEQLRLQDAGRQRA